MKAHRTTERGRARLVVAAAVGLAIVAGCGGVEWWPGAPARADLWAVAPLGNGELLAVGSSDDAWGELMAARSTDSGTTWTMSRVSGTPGLTRLAVAGNRLYASIECRPPSSGGQPLGPVPTSCLYVSSDRGVTWNDAHAGRLVDPSFADANYGWAHPEELGGGPLSETTDGGSTWHDSLAPCPSDTPTIKAAVATASRAGYVLCFAAPDTGDQAWRLVQVSVDGTVATRYQGLLHSSGDDMPGLQDDFVQGFTMQAGGRGLIWGSGGMYETADGGVTWNALSTAVLDGCGFRGGTLTADGDAYLVCFENSSEVVQRHGNAWHTLAKWPTTSGG